MSGPEISVVMSVFNAARTLHATLDSVLDQRGCELELVVVNDGSTDGTGLLLDERAAGDARLRVLHQENTGLTRALIHGCSAARGEYIARQDADDLSLPGRLAAQVGHLRRHPEVVAVTGGMRFVAPAGELLYEVQPPHRVEVDIAGDSVALPPLVGACFRRAAFERTGGFRAAFAVAQDIDMWLRLIEEGPCVGIHETMYQTTLTAGGISARRRPEQLRMAALALACARRRRAGADDAPLLRDFQPAARQPATPRSHARERAAFHYFVASCLRQRDPAAAQRYFALALSDNPFHLKALVRRFIPLVP